MAGKLLIAEEKEFGKCVVIQFDYNKILVERIKSELFPRKYIKEQRMWVTPLKNMPTVLSMFPQFEQTDNFKAEFLAQKANYFDDISLKNTEYDIDSKGITLLKHQKQAINYLVFKKQAAILDDMGVGKTFSLIYTYKALLQQGLVNKVLVICPSSLTYNWKEEIEKTKEFTYVILEGTKQKRIKLLQESKVDFFIINYEGIVNVKRKIVSADTPDIQAELEEFSSDNKCMLILDESHAIKNRKSKAFKVLKSFYKNFPCRYISSGTMVGNKPEDVWAQMYLVDPNILGSNFFGDFARRFCIMGNFFSEYAITGYKNLKQLKFIINQNSIRRLKDEVLDLPEKVFKNYYIDMDEQQRILYNRLKEQVLQTLKQDNSLGTLKTNIFYLIQMASNPKLLEGLVYADFIYKDPAHALKGIIEETAKVKELDNILDERINEGGQKVVLWANYVGTLKMLEKRYQKYNPVLVYGEVAPKERIEYVKKFQEDPNCKLFIGNPQACSTGITLTSSAVAVFFDRTYSFTDWFQAVDRIHRIGQSKTVEIICLINKDTIEMDINDMLSTKQSISDYLTNKGTTEIKAHENFLSDLKAKLFKGQVI